MNAKPQIFPDLASVASPFKGILLDAYGVFWAGNSSGLIPGAKTAMAELVKKGKVVGILSNSTQLSSKEIAKLDAHGLIAGIHFHFFLSSGDIAKKLLCQPHLPFAVKHHKFCLWGEVHPHYSSHQAIFSNTPFSETSDMREADFLYISIPHIKGVDQTDPQVFKDSLKAIYHWQLPLLCANPDQFAHEGTPPRLVVRQGSIAAMYAEMGGAVFYAGKPSKLAFDSALECFQRHAIFDPEEILMVGDTPETDVRGANTYGIPSVLVTQTGILADRAVHMGGLEIALQQLPAQDRPLFIIERLGHHVLGHA